MTAKVDLRRKRARNWKENSIRIGLFAAAFLSVLTTAGIIFVLVSESVGFFEHVSLKEFLTGTRWTPLFEPARFGVLPLVCGTFLVAVGAGVVAIPLGVGTALYLSQYAAPQARDLIKPILEVLAGVPTVVYGYFAVTFVTPILKAMIPPTQIFNAASASIVVGFMILPMVASLCDDAMRSVPASLKEAGFAMGATPFEVSTQIVFPAALSGILASFILAISRAIGETMAVTLAAGATPRLTLNPLESIQTMTAYIVQISLGDTPAGTIEYQTIFVVGGVLFVITLGLNLLAHKIVKRLSEVYE